MTNWYGSSQTKQQLDSLIDKNSKLFELFAVNQFCLELKSYNPKLLDYITNHPQLIQQAILYITVPPTLVDSHDRKYKLPLFSTEMIETQTICIINSFFKEIKQQSNKIYFDLLFDILNSIEILPLLASYLLRVNQCLINNRFKETVQRVFQNKQWLLKMLNHSEHMSIANILQLYINLDSNKSDCRLQNKNQKLKIKKDLFEKVIVKISTQAKIKTPKSLRIIQNLTTILIQTIEKYYLISDGKQIMDIITSSTSIDVMLLLLKQSNYLSYPAMNFFISLINYYSFSSLNNQEKHNSDLAKKNLQRLQSQPMVIKINNFFKYAIQKIMSSSTFSLHSYRMIEVLCHMISLSSYKILNTIKQTKFFQCLINLLFKFPQCNILHMLIEKCFLHVFISQKVIYESYKKYLFCEMDIIDITVVRFLSMFPDEKQLLKAKKKGYFGYFMKILKIYSGIQTTDENIINAIKAKGEVWNKISKILIKPYENTCLKELGSYKDVPDPVPLDFKIRNDLKIQNLNPNSYYNNVIEDIKKQQQMQNMKALQTSTDASIKRNQDYTSPLNSSGQINTQQLLNYQSNNFQLDYKNSNLKQFQQQQQTKIQKNNKETNLLNHQFEKKVIIPFPEWFKSQKKRCGLQKHISIEKNGKKSIQKKKITSSSPRKRNGGWITESSDCEQSDKNMRISIPILDRTNSNSTNNQRAKISMTNRQNNCINLNQIDVKNKNFTSQSSNNENISGKIDKNCINMEYLKKIKVFYIDIPAEKKYRKMQDKDKFLLDILGINYDKLNSTKLINK